MFISAQVSLYPLRQESLSPAIEKTLSVLRERQLDVSPGPMSTVVSGEDDVLFDALRDAFRSTSTQGDVVMVVTFSNACPVGENISKPKKKKWSYDINGSDR